MRVGLVADDFQAGNAEVDALRWALKSCGCVEILFEFSANGPGIDDCSFHGAKQAVRQSGKGRRGCGVRFHVGAPGSEQDPQGGKWEPGYAFSAKRGKDTEGRHRKHCDEDETRAEPEPMDNGDSGGEEPGGVEQGNLTQFDGQGRRGWAVLGLLEIGRPGLHRA